MYLAPLNYDRYFKKVFSDLRIAKRFLEDFLSISILELNYLLDKKNLTDDTQTVEFDFRCKTTDGYFIIEMQQWYKPDVVQRFYVYHAVGAALQLEDMPKKVVPLPDGKTRNVRDYSELLPTITIIWMVHDTLGFTDDLVSYVLTPEYISDFIKEAKDWETAKCQELVKKREKLLQLLTNTEKNIDFLQQNKLIYAFQKNIVKNKKYKKYYAWFELAEKTLKKISEKFEYEKYLQDEILSEVVRKLKTELSEKDSEGYIKTYEEYMLGVLRFERGIEKNVMKKVQGEISKAKTIAEEAKVKEEEAKIREEEAKIREEEAKIKEEEAKTIAEEAKIREEEAKSNLLASAKQMKDFGMPVDTIRQATGLSVEEIEKL